MTSGGRRFALLSALGLMMPVACLYPSYTFDEPEPTGSGAGTTSAGGGGGGTTTTTTTTGTGGSAPGEDCFDGEDNDGDDLADCADPDCEPDAECVDPIPVGWGTIGYVALAQGGGDPSCPATTPDVAYAGNAALDTPPAVCSACGCGAPTGQACELVTDLDATIMGLQPLRVRNTACGVTATGLQPLTVPSGWSGVCIQSDFSQGGQTCAGNPCNVSVESSTPVVSGGACAPTGGLATLPPVAWQINAKACRATAGAAGGCGAGKACLPRPKPPFQGRVCIGKAGDQACPSGSFTDKHVFYGDATDTRDCTACTCGGPNGGTCGMTLRLYSDPAVGTCASQVVSFAAGSCANLPAGNPGVYGREASVTQAPSGGSCPVTGGGAATGGVVPTSPTTFCCLP